MRILSTQVKTMPPTMDCGLCIYGDPEPEMRAWMAHWGIKGEESGAFTNLILPEDRDMGEMFEERMQRYTYMDGFSPNLNKHLHLGHLSNLCIASALYNLGVCHRTIAILGDTLESTLDQTDTQEAYETLCKRFNYHVTGKTFLASQMAVKEDLLKPGEGEYEGCKIVILEDKKIVAVKSDGSTTYFYQDIALAQHLDNSTLYITAKEQDDHFEKLKEMFPDQVNHLGIGFVTLNGGLKMSSRRGNTIYAEQLIQDITKEFGDEQVAINVIIGMMLKAHPTTGKSIRIEKITNPRTSPGLYLSYTMARLKSAGVTPDSHSSTGLGSFKSKELQFEEIRSREKLSPTHLLNALIRHCGNINKLYGTHKIAGSEKNKLMFTELLNDLALGMNLLGMHQIEKV
jgi:arginyl-tRNA synthetase